MLVRNIRAHLLDNHRPDKWHNIIAKSGMIKSRVEKSWEQHNYHRFAVTPSLYFPLFPTFCCCTIHRAKRVSSKGRTARDFPIIRGKTVSYERLGEKLARQRPAIQIYCTEYDSFYGTVLIDLSTFNPLFSLRIFQYLQCWILRFQIFRFWTFDSSFWTI